MSYKVTVNKGADVAIEIPFVDSNGSAFSLTDYTASILEQVSALSGLISVSIPSPSSGVIWVELEQTSSQLPVGEHEFRVQATDSSGNSIASPELVINVQ